MTFLSLLNASIPFAVIGSNQLIEVKGKKIRGRLYPWGVVEVENPEHNDFLKLRTMLVTHMQDLQEVTQDLHYENFRSERLKRTGKPVEEEVVDKDRILQQKEAEAVFNPLSAELKNPGLVQGSVGNSWGASGLWHSSSFGVGEDVIACGEPPGVAGIRVFWRDKLRRMQEMIAQMQAQMRMKPGDD
ncbi:hypothetical protein Q9966_005713 [Columba livia]|nr:hypothetical protein Q9966_005713 [Columba livia]